MKVCYKSLDINGDGKVSVDELKKALDENELFKNESRFWKQVFKGVNFKTKDYITYEEFEELMTSE